MEQVNSKSANILETFVPLDKNCELFEMLSSAGITQVKQLPSCRTFNEFKSMSESFINIVVNPQTLMSAEDIKKRSGTDYIYYKNVYGPQRILEETENLCNQLNIKYDFSKQQQQAEQKLASFSNKFASKTFGIG